MLDYDSYCFFIIYNVMGASFDQLSQIYSDLETCELNRLAALNSLKINLLIGEIAILCTTFALLSVYLIFIDKHLNLIWELLRIRARNSFFELKDNIDTRFAHIHERDELIDCEIDSSILKMKDPLRFRHSFRTIIRFSVIFIVAIFFVLLQSFLLENDLQRYLWDYPTLTSDAMNRKILATRITYYVLESRHTGTSAGTLNYLYPHYNTIASPQDNVLDNYNQLIILIDEMRNLSVKALFSQELQNYVYYSYPSNYTFLITGTLNALLYFSEESLNYGFSNVRYSIDTVLGQYFNESQALYSSMDVTTAMCISDLKNSIDSQLNALYYFTGVFVALFLIMYLCYYYPMLTFEIKFLIKLTDIIQIIPKTQNNSISKSLDQTKAL